MNDIVAIPMNMPKSCKDCKIKTPTKFCMLVNDVVESKVKTRHKECPLQKLTPFKIGYHLEGDLDSSGWCGHWFEED